MHRYTVVPADSFCAPIHFLSDDALPAMSVVQRLGRKLADVFEDGSYLLSLSQDGGMWTISRDYTQSRAARPIPHSVRNFNSLASR